MGCLMSDGAVAHGMEDEVTILHPDNILLTPNTENQDPAVQHFLSNVSSSGILSPAHLCFSKTEPTPADDNLGNTFRSRGTISDRTFLESIRGKSARSDWKETTPEVSGYNLLYAESETESAYVELLYEITKEHMRVAFNRVDTDNNDLISFKEFCYGLEHLAIRWDINEAHNAFKELDAETRSGEMDFESFCHGCQIVEPRLKEFWRSVVCWTKSLRSYRALEEKERCYKINLISLPPTSHKTRFSSSNAKEFNEEKLVDKIKDIESFPWKKRVKALHDITNIGIGTEPNCFENFFEPLCACFCGQLLDHRSVIVKECCLALGTLFTGMRDQAKLLPFVKRILEALFQNLCMTIRVTSESALQCCETLIKSIPDDPSTLPLLTVLTDHAKSDANASVREACFTFLSDYILLPNSLCLSEPPESKLWLCTSECLETGFNDADAGVRLNALHALVALDKCTSPYSNELAELLRTKLEKSSRSNYDSLVNPQALVTETRMLVSPIQRRKQEQLKTWHITIQRIAKTEERVTEIAKVHDSDNDGKLTFSELKSVIEDIGFVNEVEYQATTIFDIFGIDRVDTISIISVAVYYGGMVKDNPDALPNEKVLAQSLRSMAAYRSNRTGRMGSNAESKSIEFMGEHVKMILESYDKKKTGFFAARDLESICEEIGIEYDQKDIEKCRRELEIDGKINKEHFYDRWFDDKMTKTRVESKFQKFLKQISEDDIAEAFKRCDMDGNGFLTLKEFCFAMESLNLQWSLDDAKSAFKMLDENNDKTIDFEEFKAGIYHINADNLEVFWTRLLTGEVDEEEKEVEEKWTVELITDLLQDKKADWKKRVNAMENLVVYLKDLSSDQFKGEFLSWSEKLVLQVQDRRSQVSRAASESIAKIAAHRKNDFHSFVKWMFPELMLVVRMTGVKVVSQAAHQLVKVIVKNVHDTIVDHSVLDSITTAYSTGKVHKLQRKSAFDYLTIILEQIEQKNPEVPTSEPYMNKIEIMLAEGVSDADGATRSQAFTALAHLSFVDPDRSTKLMDGMSRVVRKKFLRIKSNISK